MILQNNWLTPTVKGAPIKLKYSPKTGKKELWMDLSKSGWHPGFKVRVFCPRSNNG